MNDFIHFYKPKLYNNSIIKYEYDLGKYPGAYSITNIHNMTCHFINKNRVFDLLEEYINNENIQYDCIISLRVDCIIKNNFEFDNLKDNTIYIPYGYDYLNNAINDQIAYGKVEVMKKHNSINPLDLLEKNLSIPHPESLNYANINFHNLQI